MKLYATPAFYVDARAAYLRAATRRRREGNTVLARLDRTLAKRMLELACESAVGRALDVIA